jgi:uncharacterized RDD family membrane protein YckC
MVYDLLLLLAVLIAATAVLLIFTGGEAITRDSALYPAYLAYLTTVIAVFYVGFWTHGGQTLGMKAWRLQVRTVNGAALDARRALLRLAASLLSWLPLGLGFLWIPFDHNRSWHDRLSGTEVVLLPRSNH